MTTIRGGAAYARGLGILAGLYSEHPSLPLGGALEIDLYQYGFRSQGLAEQIGLALAVIEQMDAPEIRLHLNRGSDSAWLYVDGYLAGLHVSVRMWANEVCEQRPQERLKRDRWVSPPELVAAVKARPAERAPAVAL